MQHYQTGNIDNGHAFWRARQQPLRVEFYLIGVPFPVNKRELLAYAEGNEAPDAVLKILMRFEEKDYKNIDEVSAVFN